MAATCEPQKAATTSMAGIVKIVVDTFLEQRHFRQLHRTLSDEWSNSHSLTAAVRLMEAHGVRVTPDEEQRLAQLPEERMIDALVMRMPQQSREQFEHFFLQLSFIASTTARMRSGLEAGIPATIEEALESAENVGVLPYILKMAVAQAGMQVKDFASKHESFLEDSLARMSPLLQSQANSMSTQKALSQARSKVDAYQVEAREKSKAVLLGLASGNEKTLTGTAFVAWSDLVKRMRREAEIRKMYEEQINEANTKLMDFKAAQLANVKSVLQRSANESRATLIGTVVGAMKNEVAAVKRTREAQGQLSDVDAQMRQFAEASASNAKKVMGRMSAGSEEGLRAMAFQGWVQFIVEYKKDKEMNDALKAAEKRVSEFMQKQNEGAKSVLQRMQSASEGGLVSSMFQAWNEVVHEARKAAEMTATMNAKSSRLTAFTSRNKDNAQTASERNSTLQDEQLLICIMSLWIRDVKCERMRRYGKERNEKKKKDLMGVKGLFKNFASELETSLKEGTPRPDAKKGGGGSGKRRSSSVSAISTPKAA